jgi:HlyD family secretion protein
LTSIWDWLMGVLVAIFPAFGPPVVGIYNGYVEAQYVYVAPSGPGRIVGILVEAGASVTQGDMLLHLDDTSQAAALQGARAGVAVAEANLDNLRTGSRSAEIEVIRATLHRAEADQQLASTTLHRSELLLERSLVPSAQVDAQLAALASADALVEQLRAQLRVSMLPARDAQLVGAEASLDVARSVQERAEADLADRSVLAPITGEVERVFFEVGEVAATGAPILSIYQPADLLAIFFVPEPERASLQIGDALSVGCDGCGTGFAARITQMATDPQYTPPIIYSREERTRLVFRAEARLANGSPLLPGQPVTLQRLP